jgi:hypothetical protein
MIRALMNITHNKTHNKYGKTNSRCHLRSICEQFTIKRPVGTQMRFQCLSKDGRPAVRWPPRPDHDGREQHIDRAEAPIPSRRLRPRHGTLGTDRPASTAAEATRKQAIFALVQFLQTNSLNWNTTCHFLQEHMETIYRACIWSEEEKKLKLVRSIWNAESRSRRHE